MSSPAAAPQPVDDEPDPPRGLTPPTQRGRSRRLLGDVIVDLGFARRETVEAAVELARQQGRTTGQILLESGALRPDQLARALAERFGVDYVDLSVFEPDPQAVDLLGIEVARRYQALPIGFSADSRLLVALPDPSNVLAIDEVAMLTGRAVRTAVATPEELAAVIERVSGQFEETGVILEPAPEPEPEPLVIEDLRDDAPVVKLVRGLLGQAVARGASDVHLNPGAGDMQVQFRIDGVLSPAASVPASLAAAAISRIKIMASLDIAERRRPQDGRLAITLDGRRTDVRVVTLPLVSGEGAVLRILDGAIVPRELGALGLQGDELDRFNTAITKPYGAILVTGPTGSGKSSTLYATLTILNDGQRSVITVEDPVESPMPGVRQIQVAPKAGLTFASGLRAILRADPDVIMVGEIRDRETAEIATHAAMTGHLVLSTLHTRDAPSALSRLLDMGVEPFMVGAAIDCVVAQRLARCLCEHCKVPADAPPQALAAIGLEGTAVFEAGGCLTCGQTGYRGRIGLYEVMPVSAEIRQRLVSGADVDEIAATAAAQGMRRMREDGLQKVAAGITSIAEVNRVTATI